MEQLCISPAYGWQAFTFCCFQIYILHLINQMLNIGTLQGPILVFGGVYSNLQALEAIKAVAQQKNIAPSNIICTGDIVAYCAQPNECVQLVKDWGIHCIAGNVEIQLANGQEDCACDFTSGGTCDTLSKQWYPFAQSQLNQAALDWMGKLPEFLMFEYARKKVVVVHGSYHNTSEFIFESTDWNTKQKNFDDTEADIILAGHCGLPFSQEKNNKHWLNPGVIGMPANDGNPQVWYMILNDEKNSFSFKHHTLDYNFEVAAKLMLEKGLPTTYAKTLETGIWDNCEILPLKETALQGKEISFNGRISQ